MNQNRYPVDPARLASAVAEAKEWARRAMTERRASKLDYFVLYVSDPAASAEWYESALGLRFEREQHGGGPVHYSTKLGDIVLELYPAGTRPTSRTRIGLIIPDPFGVRPEPATVTDPDGNTIEVRASGS